MSTLNIIRAWKDEEYRAGLSEAERALLPDNPAGLIELSDATLDGVAGGAQQPAPFPMPTHDTNCKGTSKTAPCQY